MESQPQNREFRNNSENFLPCIFYNIFSKNPISFAWVKVFRINPEFRILRLTFHRKSASKYGIKQIKTVSEFP